MRSRVLSEELDGTPCEVLSTTFGFKKLNFIRVKGAYSCLAFGKGDFFPSSSQVWCFNLSLIINHKICPHLVAAYEQFFFLK